MNEAFEFLIRELGSPEQAQPFTADQATALQNRLPKSLLEFWQEAGVGMWAQGLYQFCTPDQMQGVLRQVCGSDQDFGGDNVAVYAFTAFAQLHGWHREYGRMKVDLIFGVVSTEIPTSDEERAIHAKLGPDRLVTNGMARVAKERDIYDEDDQPLFARAQAALGRLAPGECYGFVPAIGLGGTNRLEYLRRVRAVEHFGLLAGLNRFTWMNYSDRQEVERRPIGG